MRLQLPFLTLSTLLLTACGGNAPREAADMKSASMPVHALTLSLSELPDTYEAVGTVRARTAAVISSKVMGYVREVSVRPGDRVRQGQMLVLLDARDLEAADRQAEAARNEAASAIPEADNAIAAAKASLDLAQVTFARMKDLFEKTSVSNQEFDEASARLKLAQANYEMAVAKRHQLASKVIEAEQAWKSAEVMRGYAEIRAPFDGIVTEKNVEPGNLAAPGTPLLTIERAGGYRLEASVEESKLTAVRTGQPVSVTLDALGGPLDGRVSEIVPVLDAASRAFLVKIDLPATPQLRSGLFGRARFTLGKREALSVPSAAVTERGQLLTVFVAEGGQAHARFVTLGRTFGDRAEVLSGLTPGEKLIFPVPAGLLDGAKVEVRP